MKYCKNCLSNDLRPNAKFIGDMCLPCTYSGQSDERNYQVALVKLKEKIEKIKKENRGKNNNKNYDCIVGVSGGKDSTRQAHWVRDRLGLRPLLICSAYPPKQMTNIGAKNLENLIEMGFEILAVTPAPATSAKLSLESFKKYGNVAKSTEMALFSTVPRLAIELNIKLIFWGENPALQVGDSRTLGLDEFDGNNLRNLNTLIDGGYEWMDLIISEQYKKQHYKYPEVKKYIKSGVNIIYLGPAWDDWSVATNSSYAALHGLTLRPGEELYTGDISNASMLDEEFTNINMMLKYYKYGFGRATDHVNEMIRNKVISRNDGIKLVKRYDGVCSDEIIKKYSEYVGISVDEFWRIANQYVNKKLFYITERRPIPKFDVGVDYEG